MVTELDLKNKILEYISNSSQECLVYMVGDSFKNISQRIDCEEQKNCMDCLNKQIEIYIAMGGEE